MALFPRVTVWVSNQVLTASALNGEFDNILNNAMASSLIGFSASVGQMQQQTNPGGVGSESLAGSISDELQRLRFMFAYTLGTTYWYDQTGRNLGAGNLAVQTADIVDGAVTPPKLASGFQVVPTGSILPFGGSTSPTGFLLCDGQSYLRTTYAALFTAIGTAYGSLDGTHFNVPDMRGYFPRGDIGTMGGTISAVSGNNITVTGHKFNHTGVQIRFTGSLPTGLATATTYWVIVLDANTIQVANTLANAYADVPITLSSTTTGGAVIQYIDPDYGTRDISAVGGGSTLGSQQQDQLLSHNHGIPSGTQLPIFTSSGAWHPTTPADAGAISFIASGGSETRAKNISVNYIIAT